MRWSWEYISERLKARGVYTAVYKKFLVSGEKDLTEDEAEAMDLIHRKYSYEDLLSWRRLVNASIRADEKKKKDLETKKKEAATKKGFFSRLFSSAETVSTALFLTTKKVVAVVVSYQMLHFMNKFKFNIFLGGFRGNWRNSAFRIIWNDRV